MNDVFLWVWNNISQIPSQALSFILGISFDKAWNFIGAKLVRRRFKKVFGSSDGGLYLAFGSLIVHPALVNLAARAQPILARFPLAKPGQPEAAFSAQKVASGCEIRAVAYLVSTLKRDGSTSATVVTDDSIADKLDLDFISFGALSNLKTIQILNDAANRLAEYDSSTEPGYFVSRVDRKPFYTIRKGYDYGIVLRIHPVRFPQRTWICCAGWGEWGTSGSAWYLANKWKEIAAKVNANDQFLCVVEVEQGKDESATPIFSTTDANSTEKPTTA